MRTKQIQLALYCLKDEVSRRCGYEDDVSYVGLRDIYSEEETRLLNSHSLYEAYKANVE
ncbi:MAG: hypothetical protein P4L53_08900 [Candidatus Obscuribacterales bacterium]|nr:hypothetical protein [Candidatus Obscuribacterales bacterium]